MKIACLSGKGGAGKTFTAVNLAAATGSCTYIDCDVEEPNGRLLFKPDCVKTEEVCMLLPDFDADKCTGCRQCVEFCRFHALIYIKEKPMVFSEVCHSCGGCMMVCSEHAITEKAKPIGVLETGRYGQIKVVTGLLNLGESTGVPIIRQALKKAGDVTIIDCPTGSACSVMESMMDADYCILVAEPTAFGFHNFCVVYELTALLGKKCGVVINKQSEPYEPLEQFCKEHHLPILARIPYDVQIAGMTAVNSVANPGHRPGFLPTFLADNGAEVIISGGMGGGAVDIFNERGVEVIVGVSGEANAAVETYLCGELVSTGSICHKHEHADECGGHH